MGRLFVNFHQSGGFCLGDRVFIGEGFQKLDEVSPFLFGELAGNTVLVVMVVDGQDFFEGLCFSVGQIRGGAIDSQQSRGVIFGPHQFAGVIDGGAHVVPDDFIGGIRIGIEGPGMTGGALRLFGKEDLMRKI